MLNLVQHDKKMKQIILASQSPRRKQLLDQLGLKYKVVTSNIDEKMNPRLKPRSQAENLSLQKAEKVANKYQNAIIIAADTLVVLKDEILGKPTSIQHAKKMLEKLSGKKHIVITGFTVFDTDSKKSTTDSVVTNVYMRKISKREIESYTAKEDVMDKAGAYAIQEKGAVFVEKIEGDFSNVVGLPLFQLMQTLTKFRITVL